MNLQELNALPHDVAVGMLRECCGASRWVVRMVNARPFDSLGDLLGTSRAAWLSTEPSDWLEAFSYHPRIGAREGARAQSSRASEWSASEQSGMEHAGADVARELARANREYEERFGHIFIVCATGLSATEMLAIVRKRMGNDPGDELRIAAEEQRKITEMRLLKLLGGTA